jgi:hypothetical protein
MSEAWPITPTVLVALLGWIPVVLALYCALTPRRATIACFVIGWLFLPVTTGLKIAEGVPAWDKITAITLMALVCTAIFDSARFAAFRLKWFDLPMIAYTLVPIASCAVSGDGPYEGICASFKCAMIWFGPYFLGRIYITDLDAMSELATGIVAGGLAYAPLCLFESRISPQLHNWAYGYFQHSFAQTYRLGGWRPMVFMQHGLAVGMFMTQASILALWMAVGRSPRRIIGWRLPWIAILMVFTTIMCRSSFAIVLLAVGVLVLVIGWSLNTRIGLILMILVVPAYMLTRATGLFNAEPLINAVSEYADADRGVSFAVRVHNENLIIARALEHPALGWAYSGKFLVRNEDGDIVSVPDGFWVIALGENGIVGLSLITLSILLPVILFLMRFPPRAWGHPMVAPAAAMAVVIAAHMIDNLANAMLSPLFSLPMGAMGSVYVATAAAAARAKQNRTPVAPSPLPQRMMQIEQIRNAPM